MSKRLPNKANTSYQTPVAVGDMVIDRSCFAATPAPVLVLRLFDWGLRVRSLLQGDGLRPFDCTRWERME